MRTLSDTTGEAQRVVDEVYRAMPPRRKWELLGDLYHLGRQIHAAGLLRRNPAATPAEVLGDWVSGQFGGLPAGCPFPGELPLGTPPESLSTLETVIAALDRLAIPYALGGSLASSLHGINRNTADADLSVEPFSGREAEFAGSFGPDFYVRLDAVRSAVRERSSFNIFDTSTGFKVDIFVRKERPFEVSMMSRRQAMDLSGPASRPIFVVSPEDIILLKLERYRIGGEISDRQWADVLNVLRVQSGRLDEDYLTHWASAIGVADLLSKALTEAS